MPKTSKKRSHKQGTGNERARTRADQEVTTSNCESAKQLMIREIRESSCEINFSCSKKEPRSLAAKIYKSKTLQAARRRPNTNV